MKRDVTPLILAISLACLCLAFTLPAQTTIWEEDFETEGDGIRYSASNLFYGGGNDYFGRVYGPTHEYTAAGSGNPIFLTGTGDPSNQNGLYLNYSGDYFLAGEDLDDNSGDQLDTKSITFDAIDISAFTNLTFAGLFGACNENPCGSNQYDDNDYIRVFYNIDGQGEVQALCFSADIECNGPGDVTNEPLHRDPNCDGDGGEGELITCTMQEFSFSVPNGSSIVFRVEVHANGSHEEIALDRFRLLGEELGGDCTDPVVNTISTSGSGCPGETVMLTVDGLLNDASDWHWYELGCGDTPVGVGVNVWVSPTTTTTYYVRGEPGCNGPVTCATVVVDADDSTDPVLTIPGDVTVECGESLNPPPITCGPVPLLLDMLTVNLGPGGNATLYASDFDAGSLDACVTSGLSFSFAPMGANDFLTLTCADLGVHLETVYVQDGNGNQSVAEVSYEVQDQQGYCAGGGGCGPTPVLHQTLHTNLPPSGSLELYAGLFDLASQDVCSTGSLAFSYSNAIADDSLTFTCSETGLNSLNIWVSDGDLNFGSASVLLDVQDNLGACPGTAGCVPLPLIVGGLAVDLPPIRQVILYAADFDAGSVDLCGTNGLTFSFSSDPADQTRLFTCADIGLQSLEVWVTDGNGNQSWVVTTLSVQDLQNDCSGVGFATVTDNCDPAPGLSYQDVSSDGVCPTVEVITRTWTAVDVNGNSVSLDQIITLQDTTEPTIECPDDQEVVLDANCQASLPDYTALVTAGDDCTQLPAISQLPVVGSLLSADLVVTLTATDDCGNAASCTFTVLAKDEMAPAVVCPADQSGMLDANCEFILPDYTLGLGIIDNCDPAPTAVQTPPPGTVVSDDTPISIAVSDASGNTKICSFDLLLDSNPPVFSATPGDLTVECAADVPGAQGVTANDDCDGQVQVIFTQTGLPLACPGDGTVVNTWTATDSEGHQVTHTQTVTVADQTAPVLSGMPADLTVSCLSEVPGSQGITALDNCDGPVNVSYQQSDPPVCPGDGLMTNTWIAFDCAGNSVVHTQTITIVDLTLPQFSAQPANLTVECEGEAPGAQNITATDNCGDPIPVVFTQTGLPLTCPGSGLVENTWTATDCAGNTATYTQLVLVEDITPPLFSETPPDLTVNCASEVPGDPGITATDNCGETIQVFFEQIGLPQVCESTGQVTNIWTAVDCAGNTAVHTQTVLIDDLDAPELSNLPGDLTVTCADEVPGDQGITALDNCGQPIEVEFNQTGFPLDCAGHGTITNTWTASDCAGNTFSYTQTVTIADLAGPVLSATPADLTVECALEAPGEQGITATDNCDGAVEVIFTQTGFPLDCVGEGTIVNTWTTTDCAGNTTSHSQTITIEDGTPPTLSATPGDLTVGCVFSLPGNQGIVATDNCGEPVSVVFTQSGLPLDCEGSGTVVYTWTATDCAGNATSHTQTVTVDDTTPPVLSQLPADLTISCEAAVPGNQGVTATDGCGGSVPVTFTQTGLPLTFPDPGPVVNTWTATDCNGNTVTHTQTIIVSDEIAPTALCENVIVTLDQSGQGEILPTDVDNGSTDNCAITSWSLDLSGLDCSDVGVQPVTLTVADDFGNSASCVASLTVIASEACPLPLIAYAGGPNIADPCTCRSNGEFDEEIVIGPTGVGQIWLVSSTDLLDPNTLLPYPPGTPFVEVPVGGGQSIYTLPGVHLDGQGYTLQAVSLFYPDAVLTISNTCYYPDPEIVGLDQPFCLFSPVVPLQGEVGGVSLVSESFTINGQPAMEFDAGALGIGVHTVVYTVDAGTAAPGDPSDPGCVASVTESVAVVATPSVMACNNSITVGIDQNCEALITPDMILEGQYFCYDDYSVTIKKGVNTVPNPVPGSYIGQTLTVTIEHLPSGNSCWGTLVIYDNLVPTFDCPTDPVQVGCTEDFTAVPPPPAADNCTPVTYQLIDQIFVDNNSCDDGVAQVHRVWIAIDDYGNESVPCIQVIEIVRPDDVDFPNDVIWECDQYDLFPNLTAATPLHPTVAVLQVGVNPIQATAISDPAVLGNTGSGKPLGLDGQYCGYAYSHSDQIVDECGTTFTIVRTWTVLDWCSGQVVVSNDAGEDNVQLIKVTDITPPSINRDPFDVSADIYGVHPQPCTSQDFLLPPTVSDNCHNWTVKIFTPVGEAEYVNGVDGTQGGFIPAPGLPLGVHLILYQAEDECGNTTDLFVPVEVIDDLSPVAVCDEITEVSLSSNGEAVISASVFDDGSFDNCCLDEFLVRRMDDPCDVAGNLTFGPSVIFCCADVDQGPKIVNFRVVDCFGNVNDCMVQVYVTDQLPPIVTTCPADVSITCEEYQDELAAGLALGDYSVLDPFGAPTYYDNCEYLEAASVAVNLNICTVGTITRNWTVTDPSGNGPASCTQVIQVEHVSNWVVEFPADFTAECSDGQVSTEYGEPEIFFDDCELIGVSYDDQFFYVVADACYKIIRTWTLVNWCLYDEFGYDAYVDYSEAQVLQDFDGDGDFDNRTFKDGVNDGPGPDGYIEYDQVIKFIDEEAPVFVVGDQSVCIEETDCDTDVNLPQPDVTDCSDDITISITTDLPGGSGYGPYQDVPPGVYTADYEVSDNCGNLSFASIEIVVSDCKQPTPYCENGLVVEIMQTGMVPVTASFFDAGSFDNCPGDLQFSFSPDLADTLRIYTCDSLGQNPVQLWVTDATGNQDYCETFVLIQDNMNACVDSVMVGGLIMREDDMPVEGVMVDVNGGLFTEMTNEMGMYNLTLLPGNDYSVTPQYDIDADNGVTTLDMVFIQKHILGILLLNSPYKIIAADANNSQLVTTLDLVAIQKVILGLAQGFPNNTSWRFVDMDYVFPDPMNPWSEPFPEVINFNNLDQDQLYADFIGIKVGDVNLTAVTTQFTSPDDRELSGTLRLLLEDLPMVAGEMKEIPFTLGDAQILGFQFTLEFSKEALEVLTLEAGVAEQKDFGLAFLQEGALTASWSTPVERQFEPGEVLFTLVVRALQDGRLSDWLQVSSRITPAEAYDRHAELMAVALAFEPIELDKDTFQLYQNVPNPFRGSTTIGFHLPAAGPATLSLRDLSGRVIREYRAEFEAGYHEVQLTDLPQQSGVWYYTLETATHTATRKMILLD